MVASIIPVARERRRNWVRVYFEEGLMGLLR